MAENNNEQETPLIECSDDQEQIDEKNAYEDYERRYKYSYELYIESNKLYDKSLQMVDSGAIVIGFTYILQSKSNSYLEFIYLFITTLVVFAVAIAIGLIAQYIAIRMYSEGLLKINLEYKKAMKTASPDEICLIESLEKKVVKKNKCLSILNCIQLYASLAGIIILGIFISISVISLHHEQQAHTSPKSTNSICTEYSSSGLDSLCINGVIIRTDSTSICIPHKNDASAHDAFNKLVKGDSTYGRQKENRINTR